MILFLSMFLFFLINNANAQIGVSTDEIVIMSGISRGWVKPLKDIYVFNRTLVKDSVSCMKLLTESKSYKTKIKTKGNIPDELARKIGLDADNYVYRWKIVEIKDVIIDPETMKLIKIK